jgi:hypothetical protein
MGIVLRAEPVEAGEELAAGFFGFQVEEFAERSPGFAGLEAAIFRVLVFGILGRSAYDQFAQPALDQERREVEWVLFLFSKGFGFLEISEEGQPFGSRWILTVHPRLTA